MDLFDYFENTKGIGILSTASAKGIVDAAIYARPHFIDEKICAFIMSNKLTHKNLTQNPNAVYLFLENTKEYKGKRLYLEKIKDSEDKELINKLRRRKYSREETNRAKKFLTYFQVKSVRTL
ncbi:MAG: pyridoxamine 5'-phosphate oxidase family protein [Candidatus Omnitrophota bacterium]